MLSHRPLAQVSLSMHTLHLRALDCRSRCAWKEALSRHSLSQQGRFCCKECIALPQRMCCADKEENQKIRLLRGDVHICRCVLSLWAYVFLVCVCVFVCESGRCRRPRSRTWCRRSLTKSRAISKFSPKSTFLRLFKNLLKRCACLCNVLSSIARVLNKRPAASLLAQQE